MKKFSIPSGGITLVLFVALFFLWTFLPSAQGAGPAVILNWQAGTYVPQGYAGKALPITDSRITVGVDLINQGRRVDLSSLNVVWYLNEKFYQGGVGLTRVSFTAPHYIGSTSVKVRVFIPDYGGGPGKTITVPVVPPEVAIRASSLGVSALTAPFTLQAIPFFFNVSSPAQLQFAWRVNGAAVGTQNPFTVTSAMVKGGQATIEVTASNPARAIERTTKDITL